MTPFWTIALPIIGTILTNIVTGFTTWFFARKRYNSEVDNNLIQNMQESLDFYKQLSDDNKARLKEVLDKNNELEARDEKLESEVRELRSQLFKLMGSICTDLSCQIRKRSLDLEKQIKDEA